MHDEPWGRDILILLGLAVLNGFFSMAEMAVVSARKARLKAAADAGKAGYARALKTAEEPGPFLSTIQIAITLIGLVSGAFGGTTLAGIMSDLIATIPLLAPWADVLGLALVILGLTLATIVIGELVPKQLALSRPERIASWIVAPVRVVGMLFLPVEKALSAATRFILWMFRIRAGIGEGITAEEIKVMLHEGEQSGNLEHREKVMVEHVFHLGDRRVEAFMTHRSDLEWLPLDTGPEEVLAFLHMRSRFRLVPVCREGLDEIAGMADSYSLLVAFSDGSFDSLGKHLHPPLYLPSSMTALKALELFRQKRAEAGVVLDEYGGVMGMVDPAALLDALTAETIVPGVDGTALHADADGWYQINGHMDIHDFCVATGIPEPEGSNSRFQTVAGYILLLAGAIPRPGFGFDTADGRFEVLEMEGNRVAVIRFRKSD